MVERTKGPLVEIEEWTQGAIISDHCCQSTTVRSKLTCFFSQRLEVNCLLEESDNIATLELLTIFEINFWLYKIELRKSLSIAINLIILEPWSSDATFHPTFRPTFFSMLEVGGQTIQHLTQHFTQHFHAQIEKGLSLSLRSLRTSVASPIKAVA